MAKRNGWTSRAMRKTDEALNLPRFKRMYFASHRFDLAARFARLAYTSPEWEKMSNGQGQSDMLEALLYATVIAYMAPFQKSWDAPDVWEKLLVKDMPYDSEGHALHEFLDSLRHKIMAHTEGNDWHGAEITADGVKVTQRRPEVARITFEEIECLARKAAKYAEGEAQRLLARP